MKMNYTDIFFDMDGTINESGKGIKRSFRYAMEKLGMPLEEGYDLDHVIGPPLSWSFSKAGAPADRVEEAVTAYRELYNAGALFESDPYPGVVEMLETLKAKGKKLHIATSKPDVMTLRILNHFHLREYFDVIATATMDESRSTKEDVITYGLGLLGDVPREAILMVGDRYHDIEGAKANGLDSVGVLYGYGTREELENAGATYLAETPREVAELL